MPLAQIRREPYRIDAEAWFHCLVLIRAGSWIFVKNAKKLSNELSESNAGCAKLRYAPW